MCNIRFNDEHFICRIRSWYVSSFCDERRTNMLIDLEERANQLLQPRQANCVPCPVNPPACPVCPSGQECQIMSQSCTQCAISQCIPTATLNNLAGNTTPPPVQSNTGVIAGGIAGALVFLLLVAGSLFYWRRKKRVQVQDLDAWLSSSGSMEEKGLRESISTRGTVWFFLCSSMLMVGCEFVTSFYCRDYHDTGFKYHSNRISAVSSAKHNAVLQHRYLPRLRSTSRFPQHHPLPSTHPILLRRRYPPLQPRDQRPRHPLHRHRNSLLHSRYPVYRT